MAACSIEYEDEEYDDRVKQKKRLLDDYLENEDDECEDEDEFILKKQCLNNKSVSDIIENYERPEAPEIDSKSTPFRFMLWDIKALMENGKNSIIRMFGVTANRNSVMVEISGFSPYFFVLAPPGFKEEHCESMRVALCELLVYNSHKKAKIQPNPVSSVTIHMKENIMGFKHNKKIPFLRIDVLSPYYIRTLCSAAEKGLYLPPFGQISLPPYNSDLPHILTYMIDRDIVGCDWIELPANQYNIVPILNQKSTCQYEIKTHELSVKSLGTVGEHSSIAPVRVLSFDIECEGRKGHFPVPKQDPVIQIACTIQEIGNSNPIYKTVLTWRPSNTLVGCKLINYGSEEAMLLGFTEFIMRSDPDCFTGYNTDKFDWRYLYERAEVLGIDDFALMSRIKGKPGSVKESTFSSGAFGTMKACSAEMEGRLQFDMYTYIQRNAKLRSYTLNNVSSNYLGEQKEDVHHTMISVLWNGTDGDRNRLASYCLKDAILPLRLMNKLMAFINTVEMARATGVPFMYITDRGQTIKVSSKLARILKEEDLLVPTSTKSKCSNNLGKGVAFEGATVFDPIRGYYEVPIATLDFASLYPSIMMAHNLCYTTLLRLDQIGSMKEGEDYVKTPTGDYFATPKTRKGVLPRILDDLLAARKRARIDLANETDPFKKAVFDGRQLALKVTANSVYGYTGAAQQGRLPCLQISASVTAFGRQMIDQTKKHVESHYNIANGYKFDSEVIYGDTDSVMIKFGNADLKECMDMAKEAAVEISKTFITPIKLEFEKCYWPYLLINKKRYAGLFWTKCDKPDKLDTKGLETVRRDNAPIISELLKKCLDFILIKRDVKGAIVYVEKTLSDLLLGIVDISQLVISKNISKEDYKNKQIHVELAKRMKIRDPSNAPGIGDRVPYIILKGAKNSPTYERSEDPIYALEHNLPIDTAYYIKNQLEKPLMRLFKALMPDPSKLFIGDHMRHIAFAPASKKIGMGMFAKPAELCMGCKTPLDSDLKTLCNHCRPNCSKIYQNQLKKVRQHEKEHSAYWTNCQDCQGSLLQPVYCSNSTCPIFYARTKTSIELKKATDELARFSIDF